MESSDLRARLPCGVLHKPVCDAYPPSWWIMKSCCAMLFSVCWEKQTDTQGQQSCLTCASIGPFWRSRSTSTVAIVLLSYLHAYRCGATSRCHIWPFSDPTVSTPDARSSSRTLLPLLLEGHGAYILQANCFRHLVVCISRSALHLFLKKFDRAALAQRWS